MDSKPNKITVKLPPSKQQKDRLLSSTISGVEARVSKGEDSILRAFDMSHAFESSRRRVAATKESAPKVTSRSIMEDDAQKLEEESEAESQERFERSDRRKQ